MHYGFNSYLTKGRWDSMWHQLDEVLRMSPENVLEIGPGPGVFKAIAKTLGVNVETLDLDPELEPDYLDSVLDMPFEDNHFDVVCAFQMLEHLPYEKSLEAFKEMSRIARIGVVISLPDAKRVWPVFFNFPKLGRVPIPLFNLRLGLKKHVFDGEHYWEINKKNYSLKKVINDFSVSGWMLNHTFLVTENPYHRFFIYTSDHS